MNQKILVALTVIAICLGILNLVLLFVLSPEGTPLSVNTPQDIPLTYKQVQIRIIHESQIQVYVKAEVEDNLKTLYDCEMKLDYLTNDSIWKSDVQYLGTINFHTLKAETDDHVIIDEYFYLDSDFQYDENSIHLSNMFLFYSGNNIKVEAYGYLKP